MSDNNQDQFLTPEDIFAADDLDTLDVEIPEWTKNGKAGVIRLKALTAQQAIDFGEIVNNPKSKNTAIVQIIALSAIRPDGTPLFTRAQAEMLKQKSAKVFLRIQKAALKLNGFDADVEKQVGNDSGEES